MKQLLKASAMLGVAQAAALVFKLINTKFLAVFLEPYGVGVFNQLAFFHLWIILLTALGTGQGTVKYVSEYNADGKYAEIRKIIVTLGVLLFGLSLIAVLGIYLFADRISLLLFGSAEYTNLISLLPFALPQSILAGFCFCLVQAFRPIKQLSLFMVAEAGIGVLILIPLVYFWNLQGAVINIIVVSLCQLVMIWWIYHRYCPLRITLRDVKLFEFKSLYRIINYGAVFLIVQVVQYLVLTILFRRLIITRLGIEANGVYSPAYGLSYQSMLLIYYTIYIYSFTKISEAKQLSEVSAEVNKLLRIALLIMTPVFFILISYREWLILFLYTDKFMAVTQIMPVQFIGDFFRVIGLAVALPIFARANLRAMLVFDVSIYLIFYGIASVMIPKYGLSGAAVSYLIMYLLYILAVFPYMRSYIKFRFEKNNYLLMGLSFLILIVAGILNLSLGYLIMTSVVILGSWSLMVLTKAEREYVRETVADVWLRAKDRR